MPAGSYRFQVGSLTCTVLSDGYFAYPTSWFFPNAEPDRLRAALEARRLPTETVLSPYTCLLVQTGRHTALIDTGGGAGSSTTGAIGARLEMEGIRPGDVDTVVISHAHADHLGGAVDAIGRPVFRNARYVMTETEWEFWTAARTDLEPLRVPEDVKRNMQTTARRSLGALRHQLEPIDREAEVAPGVRAIPAPGHTPGHLAVLLHSDGELLLNVGDAAVHPLHLEEPEWENGFDLAGGTAKTTRRDLLHRAAAEGMRLMAFHFPFPSVGKVTARPEGGWTWTPGC